MGSTLILLHKPKEGLQFLQQAVDIASQQLEETKERHLQEKERIGEGDRHSKEREREREREEGKAKREWFLSRLALGNGLRDSGVKGAAEEYEGFLFFLSFFHSFFLSFFTLWVRGPNKP